MSMRKRIKTENGTLTVFTALPFLIRLWRWLSDATGMWRMFDFSLRYHNTKFLSKLNFLCTSVRWIRIKILSGIFAFSHSENIHRKIAPPSIVAFSTKFLWMSASCKPSEFFNGLWLMTVVSTLNIAKRIRMTNSIDMQTSFHLNLLTQCYWFVVRSLMILSQWELQNRASGLPCETIRSHTESKKENCQIKKFVRYEQM